MVEITEIRKPDDVVGPSEVHYIPHCEDDKKPHIGMKFQTLSDGEKFYMAYGAACGFQGRLGNIKRSKSNVITRRILLCSREGHKQESDSKMKRRRMTTRVDCKARAVLTIMLCGSGYVFTEFVEAHNHAFISDNYKHFMRYNRNLDDGHKKFVMNCLRANIGPVKSFRLFKELVSGYDTVGCTIVDFKNFTRDLRAHVVGVDAQVLLMNLHSKTEICRGFRFDYSVDSSDKLTRLFWADPTSIEMYNLFGEALSFDATYSTNKYNLIFVPFTGKDNHGRCVTFAAGLISHEDEESYSWILGKFVECMGKKPRMIITDQDPALKKSVEDVLEGTRHRLCMWHIMNKVADKVSVALRNDPNFKKELYSLVWSEDVDVTSFEEKWHAIMEEYGLVGDKWFDCMFGMRSSWIPAFFRDCEMSGLFRTTSMSESENGFFKRYMNKSSNLLEFFMHFERAVEAQRNEFHRLNNADETSFPKLVTELDIERHAASIYTNSIFVDVQKAIVCASFSCCILDIRGGDCERVYTVDDGKSQKFNVVYNVADSSCCCDCTNFVRHGLVCSHIFCVYKNLRFSRIPDKYIVSHWRKFCDIKKPGFEGGSMSVLEKDIIGQLYAKAHSCISLVQGDSMKMEELLQAFQELHDSYSVSRGSMSNTEMFDQFYGGSFTQTEDFSGVGCPVVVKNKGGGKRIKSSKEKAIKKAQKPLRRCSRCKQMRHHDARNCDEELVSD